MKNSKIKINLNIILSIEKDIFNYFWKLKNSYLGNTFKEISKETNKKEKNASV